MQKNSNIIIQKLSWDSDYFNVPCASIIINGDLSKSDYSHILSALKDNVFCTIKCPTHLSSSLNWIGENTSAFLTDVNLSFTRNTVSFERNKNVEILNNAQQLTDVEKIAEKAFIHSRFLHDGNIHPEKAKNIYFNWIKNSYNSEDKYFAIYKENNSILGYILFHITDNLAVIELLAVDETHRKKGIASAVTKSVIDFVHSLGVNTINVGTQIANIGAINFYNRQGFSLTETTAIYHCWNK